jgi:D-alanyl-D-alanine carboxypeptidase (penicillin-binding protein 5/6)
MMRPAISISKLAFRLLAVLALALSFGVNNAGPALAQVTELDGISSERYIVIDAETGEVFVAHNADEQAPIASLTKVFTTIEALELAKLDTPITTNSSDLFGADSTTMGFGPGETFTLNELLYGMMLPSGNDAAHAIARSLGYQDGMTDTQAVASFMDLINQRVLDMGLTNTHLENPHGLSQDGHYSTASDIATFVMYALQYPVFEQLIGTSSFQTDSGYYVSNTNKMLNSYSGLIGGKTGYDDEAGYCLIEVATRDGSTMISVTLDGEAPDIWYEDNAILLDYAFEAKAEREAEGRQISNAQVSFRDPDAAQILAQSRGGNSIGSIPEATPSPVAVDSDEGVASPVAGVTSNQDESAQGNDRRVSTPVIVVGALAALSVAAFCGWMAFSQSQRRKAAMIVPSHGSTEGAPD